MKGEVGTTMFVIRSAAEHRRLLLDSMVRVADGRMNVLQANAVASLSAEVHKSLRLEWDMVTYAGENFQLGPGNKVMLLPPGKDDDGE